MYKLIIFDLDGTLLETSRDIQLALNLSLAKFGYSGISLDDTLKFVGNGAKKLVERVLPDCADTEKVYKDFSVNYENSANELTSLYIGEEQFLKRCEEQGIKSAILTNKPQLTAERVCKKHLGRFNFISIIGQSEKFPLKPDPTSTLEIIKNAGVNKEECLFVGDGETDVLTARNAGIDCVSALWGFRKKSELSAVGARVFAENYVGLGEIIFNKKI